MKYPVSYLVLTNKHVQDDWKLSIEPKEKNNGRQVLVNEIRYGKECCVQDPEWKAGPNGGETSVLETGFGGVEVATFTNKAGEDCHKHLIGTEIYTVLEGSMKVRLEEKKPITLEAGDELVVLPGTVHEVLPDKNDSFLTRVHTINCYGSMDKYMKRNGKWCQDLTLKELDAAEK